MCAHPHHTITHIPTTHLSIGRTPKRTWRRLPRRCVCIVSLLVAWCSRSPKHFSLNQSITITYPPPPPHIHAHAHTHTHTRTRTRTRTQTLTRTRTRTLAAQQVGAKELRFAKPADTEGCLKVSKGCITALCLINAAADSCTYVCDETLMVGEVPRSLCADVAYLHLL
jgi:hypothetical protein